jgi:hypothetical protein
LDLLNFTDYFKALDIKMNSHLQETSYLKNVKDVFFFSPYCTIIKSQESIVGIVTGYGLDDQGVGVQVPVGTRIFTSP